MPLNAVVLGQELITEFLTGIQDALIAYMQSDNRNATGKSVRSLKVTANQTSGQLTGAPYIEFVFRGRGPGKFPPLSAIIDWLNARGLPRGMAWSVARKIAEAGTRLWQQGRNVLNEIITADRIKEFTDKLVVTYKAQIASEIQTLIAA